MDKIDLIYDMVKNIDSTTTELKDRMTIEEVTTKHIVSELKDTNNRMSSVENKLTVKYLLKFVATSIVTTGSVAAAIYKIIGN